MLNWFSSACIVGAVLAGSHYVNSTIFMDITMAVKYSYQFVY